MSEVNSMKLRENKHGQVTLEAAISFTITLVFLASVISAINLYRTDILMRRACEQTCEKMSLLYPVSVPAEDAISTAVNAFPDLGIGDTKGAEVISKVISAGSGLDEATGHTLKELILQGVFSRTMEEQIRNAYIERNGGSVFFMPEEINVFFEINDKHHIIEVVTEYDVVTIAGRKERSIYSVIPLYGDPVLVLQGEEANSGEEDENRESVWSLSNFSRGDTIRDRFGANMPKTFPVIDAVDGGKVTAIRSIDLTSPYYQDPANIEKKLMSDIRSLSRFEPRSAIIDGREYSVDHVSSRHLKVVIPENSGSVGKSKVDELKGYAIAHGVILEICEYETSDKYGPN